MKKYISILSLLIGTLAFAGSATIDLGPTVGGGGGTTSPLTTKGDIWGFSTTNDRIPACANGEILQYDSTFALGVKCVAPTGTGTVTNVSGTSPINVANPTTTPAITIDQATTSTDGYLSSTDWNTFNNKQDDVNGAFFSIAGFDGSGNLSQVPNLLYSDTATNVTYLTGYANIANTVTGLNYIQVNGAVDGASINGFRGLEIDGNYGQTTATTLDNVIEVQLNPHHYANSTVNNYIGLGIGGLFDVGSTMSTGMSMINSNPQIDTSGTMSYFNGYSNATNFGNNGPGVALTNYNGITEQPGFHNASSIDNYMGAQIVPQFLDTTTVNTFTGMSISPGTSGTITNAAGLRIVMNGGANITGNKVSLETQGGIVNINSQTEMLSAQTFAVSNQVGGGFVANADITGTDFIGNSLVGLLEAHGNVANGPLGIGVNQVGFVGQVQIDAGKTIDQFNGVVSGYSWGDTNGTITDTAAYLAIGSLPGGGTVTNQRGFYAPALFGTGGATNLWGVYIAPNTANNYFAGNVLVGNDQPTNASVGIEINASDKSLLLSRMSSAQETALTATNGMMIYNSDTNKFRCYEAGAWTDCVAAGGGGANTALSNLASVALNTDIIPDTDQVYDLGSGPLRFDDVYARALKDASNNVIVDLQTSQLLNTGANIVMDWQNAELYDGAGVLAVNLGNRILKDSSNLDALNWDAKILYDATGTTSVDWSGASRVLVDSSNVNSVLWGARELRDTTGNVVFYWGAAGAGSPVVAGQLLMDTYNGNNPSITAGCGTTPSVSGVDGAGQITVGTGGATSCTMTFGNTWIVQPHCSVTSRTDFVTIKVNPGVSSVVISTNGTFSAGSVLDYICVGG